MRTTRLTRGIVVGGIALVASIPFMGINQFWIFFITVTITQAILLSSLNLTLGYAGLISLGHNALYAVGGYATAYFTVTMGLPVAVGIVLGLAFGALAGCALALTTFRARAVYFGIITLAFLFLTYETVSKWPVLGGFRGFPAIPGLSMFGVRFGRNEYFWFALGVFVLAMGALQQLSSSALGRSFVAIRENEAAAASLGIDPFRTKVLNLAVSGGLAGLSGALFAHLAGGIFPESASFSSAIRLFVAIVVGGTGTFAGPLVGIGIVATIDRFTVNWTTAQPIIFSAMLLGSLALMRFGLVGTVLTSRFGKLFLALPKLEPRTDAAPTAAPVASASRKRRRRTDAPSILEVRDLAKRFDGVQALAGVDLIVTEGTIHGLIGPNGSGKSTLVNCVTGFLRPESGTVVFAGRDVGRSRPYRRARSGMVRIFQHSETFGRLLVIQNVIMGLHLHADRNFARCLVPWPNRRRVERQLIGDALQLLHDVGLAHRALSPVSALSYGEQRLLEIARAVASHPRLLILDEPATGLTSSELVRLATLLRRLKTDGTTILLIEHNMEFVMGLVDHVTVLERGSCIASGAPARIQRDENVIEAYLGERIPA
jgi:ABC-type branched-subunit amino acid transport system ATPase component/ABC-type branched-subunit amino acid transport system permease subunit